MVHSTHLRRQVATPDTAEFRYIQYPNMVLVRVDQEANTMVMVSYLDSLVHLVDLIILVYPLFLFLFLAAPAAWRDRPGPDPQVYPVLLDYHQDQIPLLELLDYRALPETQAHLVHQDYQVRQELMAILSQVITTFLG